MSRQLVRNALRRPRPLCQQFSNSVIDEKVDMRIDSAAGTALFGYSHIAGENLSYRKPTTNRLVVYIDRLLCMNRFV